MATKPIRGEKGRFNGSVGQGQREVPAAPPVAPAVAVPVEAMSPSLLPPPDRHRARLEDLNARFAATFPDSGDKAAVHVDFVTMCAPGLVEDRLALLSDPDLPGEVLDDLCEQLWRYPDPEGRLALAARPNTSPDVLDALYEGDPLVDAAVLENPNCPQDLYRWLAVNDHGAGFEVACRRLDVATVTDMALSSDVGERAAARSAAVWPDLPLEVQVESTLLGVDEHDG